MNLARRTVFFRLSSEGDNALKSVIPAGGSFVARVVDQDDLGLWVELQEQEAAEQAPIRVMLLKWDYLSTAVFDFAPEQPVARERPGFR